MAIVLLIIFGVVYIVSKAQLDSKVNSYPLDRVNTIKMQADNCSPAEKQRRMVAGYYDKDANHPY